MRARPARALPAPCPLGPREQPGPARSWQGKRRGAAHERDPGPAPRRPSSVALAFRRRGAPSATPGAPGAPARQLRPHFASSPFYTHVPLQGPTSPVSRALPAALPFSFCLPQALVFCLRARAGNVIHFLGADWPSCPRRNYTRSDGVGARPRRASFDREAVWPTAPGSCLLITVAPSAPRLIAPRGPWRPRE